MVPSQRPVLETTAEGGGLPSVATVLDVSRDLGVLGLGAGGFVATVVVATTVIGLFPAYGKGAVRKAAGSPLLSTLIGVPLVSVLGGLSYTGFVLAGTDVGTFFAVPLVVAGVLLFPVWAATGLVAIGSITARVGAESLSVGVIVGGIAGGIATLTAPYGIAILTLAAAVGAGGSTRVILGGGPGSDRVVPPTNRI